MRRTIITIILFLLLTNIAIAQEETTQPVNLQELETKKIIIEENAKTRSDIKQFIDRRIIEYQKETNKIIDENFIVLDKRIDSFIRKAAFKLGIVWFSATVFAGTIILFINRAIKRRVLRKKSFKHEGNKVIIQEAKR